LLGEEAQDVSGGERGEAAARQRGAYMQYPCMCGMRAASLVESSGSSGRSRAAQPDGEAGLGAKPWQRAQPHHASKQPACMAERY
jgi:hypothetical protein